MSSTKIGNAHLGHEPGCDQRECGIDANVLAMVLELSVEEDFMAHIVNFERGFIDQAVIYKRITALARCHQNRIGSSEFGCFDNWVGVEAINWRVELGGNGPDSVHVLRDDERVGDLKNNVNLNDFPISKINTKRCTKNKKSN